MCVARTFKKRKSSSEENMYLFEKYQEVMQHFDTTDDANQRIEALQRKYKYATLGWIYEKILFDMKREM